MSVRVTSVSRIRDEPRRPEAPAEEVSERPKKDGHLYVRRLTPHEETELWRKAQRNPKNAAKRARLILLSAAGTPVSEIAAELKLTPVTVRRWIHRFNTSGTAGLANRDALFARPATNEEVRELQRMIDGGPADQAERAQMVFQSMRRLTVAEIAHINRTSTITVRRWINRYNIEGPAGLQGRKPPGRAGSGSDSGQDKSGRIAGLVTGIRLWLGEKARLVALPEKMTVIPTSQNGSGVSGALSGLNDSLTGAIRSGAAAIGVQDRLLDSALLHGLALIVVLGLAVGIRTVQLNAIGYNSDEAVYAGQGAAIAQAPILSDIFPIFRAHPLLFQFTLALFFSAFGAVDWLGRLVSVGVGIITVYLVYRLGRRLYGPKAGLIAALIMALMPYHVVVTRQVLLDGSMALFATLTLWLMVRFAETKRPVWLYAAGAGMGLTFLAKETGILMIGAIYAFLALSPQIRVRIRDIIVSMAIMVLIMLPFPLSLSLSGGGSERSAGNYLVWQLFRRPNHTFDFYFVEVPPAIGILVFLAAISGLILLRKKNGWKERLLVLWIIGPTVFFQLWPTKGFQYLLPIAPAVALLAARMLAYWPTEDKQIRGLRIPRYLPGLIFTVIIALSLFQVSWSRVMPSQSDTFLAGSGGIPGGRETGEWIQNDVPEGSIFMTIGPSMANIIKWYGHQDAYGLSVSPNPLHRNPSYEPVYNPDYDIRTGELQYLVWDSFSAGRTSFFSEKLLWYVQKYNGRAVHTETVTVTTPDGATVEKPVIIVYKVHP